MVLTPSAMVPLGTDAPDFQLPDTEGNIISRGSFAGKPLLVAFLCVHCPYVKHLKPQLAEVTRRLMEEHGIAVVAISSNDIDQYPEDDPEHMAADKARFDFPFPYLYDETQEVAKAYDAQCTPDFFLFDADHRLVYRGQFDDSRPESPVLVTGKDLIAAVEAMARGEVLEEQRPSMGCNVKWKAS